MGGATIPEIPLLPWHGHREAVFVLMRAIDAEAENHADRARFLSGGSGRPVGAAAFDEELKREALWSFLRQMRRGFDPVTAAAVALDESRIMVRSWNKNPRCVVINHPAEAHRWEDTCGAMLDDRARRFAGIPEPEGWAP